MGLKSADAKMWLRGSELETRGGCKCLQRVQQKQQFMVLGAWQYRAQVLVIDSEIFSEQDLIWQIIVKSQQANTFPGRILLDHPKLSELVIYRRMRRRRSRPSSSRRRCSTTDASRPSARTLWKQNKKTQQSSLAFDFTTFQQILSKLLKNQQNKV